MPDKIVNHFVLADGSVARYDAVGLVGVSQAENYILNGVTEFSNIQNIETATGWKLLGNGLCALDDTAILIKYPVVAGDLLYLKLSKDFDGVYQFQNSKTVSASITDYVIGNPVTTETDSFVFVPSGATWLIVSQKSSNTSNTVKQAVIDYDFLNQEIDTIISGAYVEPEIVVNGWQLHGDGSSRQSNNSQIIKYPVIAGDTVTIIARLEQGATYQFQDRAVVAGPNDPDPDIFVKGEIVKEDFAGTVTVPVGATYLIIGRNTGSNNGSYGFSKGETTTEKPALTSPYFVTEKLIAHKGGNQGHDGTYERLDYSVAHGYKILEVDLQLTSDGAFVVQHDPTITVGGEAIQISSKTLAELRTYDLGNGQHILTFTEALLYCKKRGLILEIDLSNVGISSTHATTLVDYVTKRGMLGSTYFTGLPSVLDLIVANSNDCNLSVSNLYDTTTTDTIDTVASYKDKANVVICSINHANVTEILVNYAHEKGLLVKTWTHTTAETVNADLSIGVDLAICDNGIYPDNFVITN